jgi:hypothetical protein
MDRVENSLIRWCPDYCRVSRMIGARTESAWRSTKLITVTEKRSAKIHQRT